MTFTLDNGMQTCTSASPSDRFSCGYHGYSHFGPGKGYNRYILLPFLGRHDHGLSTCFEHCYFGNQWANLEYAFSGLLADTMTNPDLDNWQTDSGEEVGTICDEYNVLRVPSPPMLCPEGFDKVVYTRKLWSNEDCKCV